MWMLAQKASIARCEPETPNLQQVKTQLSYHHLSSIGRELCHKSKNHPWITHVRCSKNGGGFHKWGYLDSAGWSAMESCIYKWMMARGSPMSPCPSTQLDALQLSKYVQKSHQIVFYEHSVSWIISIYRKILYYHIYIYVYNPNLHMDDTSEVAPWLFGNFGNVSPRRWAAAPARGNWSRRPSAARSLACQKWLGFGWGFSTGGDFPIVFFVRVFHRCSPVFSMVSERFPAGF